LPVASTETNLAKYFPWLSRVLAQEIPMTSPQPPFQLQLTEEQMEILHRVTGEHVAAIELTADQGDGNSGTGRGLRFAWRISVDSGIPRQQWAFGGVPPTPAPDKEGSA
jgi:hypothetical protein